MRERETDRQRKKEREKKNQSPPQINNTPIHHAPANLHRAWQTDRQMEKIDKHSLMTDRQTDNLFTRWILVKKLHRP